MGLKPSTNDGFVQPEPGKALFLIDTVEFTKYGEGELTGKTYCKIKVEIADCEVESNIGMTMFDRYNQFDMNGRYFGVENLLGVIWKATGKELEVDADYFLDSKVQDKVVKNLTGQMFGGEIVADKTGKYRNIKQYMTKQEYKEAGKKTNGKQGAKQEETAKVADDTGDGWD